jgi:hypothetical protein
MNGSSSQSRVKGKSTSRPYKSGEIEILGIESRQWRNLMKSKDGWGGYPSKSKKVIQVCGFVLFLAVWVFLAVWILS